MVGAALQMVTSSLLQKARPYSKTSRVRDIALLLVLARDATLHLIYHIHLASLDLLGHMVQAAGQLALQHGLATEPFLAPIHSINRLEQYFQTWHVPCSKAKEMHQALRLLNGKGYKGQ